MFERGPRAERLGSRNKVLLISLFTELELRNPAKVLPPEEVAVEEANS